MRVGGEVAAGVDDGVDRRLNLLHGRLELLLQEHRLDPQLVPAVEHT